MQSLVVKFPAQPMEGIRLDQEFVYVLPMKEEQITGILLTLFLGAVIWDRDYS